MSYTLNIVNSYIYIYGKDVYKYRELIGETVGTYSKINIKSDKLLLNIGYKIMKRIEDPEDIVEYINEFLIFVDNLITTKIEDELGIDLDYHSVSNIVFSGQLIFDKQKFLDLYALKRHLKNKYGERIIYCDRPQSNGNEFAGLVIRFIIDPTLKNKRGKTILKRNRNSIIMFSNGKFIWTGINDSMFDDADKLSIGHEILEDIRTFDADKIDLNEILI